VLQALSDGIRDALDRAAEADRRAADASDERIRADNVELAKKWRVLAQSLQAAEQLESYLLGKTRLKSAEPSKASPTSNESCKPTSTCASCGNVMRLIHSNPPMEGLPQICTFRCYRCDEVVTVAEETRSV
jgi:hypothetical protein